MENGKTINIEEIMDEIRAEIREKGYTKEELSFEDLEIPEAKKNADWLEGELEYLSANHLHDVEMPVEAGNPIAGFIKNVIRKLVKFILYPILAFQNRFNASTVTVLEILAQGMTRQEEILDKMDKLEERIEELERRLNKEERF